MFQFREAKTFVRCIWKGDGDKFGVLLILWADHSKSKTWHLHQSLHSVTGEYGEKNFSQEVETPDHAMVGTLRILNELGGLLGLKRLQRADIGSDSYDDFISGLSKIDGIELHSMGQMGNLSHIGQA